MGNHNTRIRMQELIKILTKEVKPLIEKILLELAKEKITLYRGQVC